MKFCCLFGCVHCKQEKTKNKINFWCKDKGKYIDIYTIENCKKYQKFNLTKYLNPPQYLPKTEYTNNCPICEGKGYNIEIWIKPRFVRVSCARCFGKGIIDKNGLKIKRDLVKVKP